MKILGIDEKMNKNYKLIKDTCKQQRIKLCELSDKLYMSRQNFYDALKNDRLKKIYIEKIENILNIELEK